MADDKIPADIKKLSFEDALAEMEEIVRRLESGQVKLDEAVDAYARGAHL
ncbi:MAG: exodeoxyribonuclease VII small subunit, partial [Rhodospirillales bacterium]